MDALSGRELFDLFRNAIFMTINNILTILPLTGALVFGCSRNQVIKQTAPSVPVVVAKVSQQTMPVELTSVGNVEACSAVSIRARISGQLPAVHFKEGDFVHKGQLLLTIDSRPYQAQVEQAKGAIVKDQAQLEQAQANLAKDTAQQE